MKLGARKTLCYVGKLEAVSSKPQVLSSSMPMSELLTAVGGF